MIEAPRRRRWWRVLAVGVALSLAGGFTFAFASDLGKNPAEVASALLGRPAPSFDLAVVGGSGLRVSSTSFAGHVEVVNVWASWCVACRQEVPYLNAFAHTWTSRGVGLVGLVYADSDTDVAAFESQYHITWPSLADPGDQVALRLGVSGVPETFVIGPDGRLRAHLIGAIGPATMDYVMGQLATSGVPLTLRTGRTFQAPGH